MQEMKITDIPTEKLQASAFMLGEQIAQHQQTIQAIRQELNRRVFEAQKNRQSAPVPQEQPVSSGVEGKKLDLSKLPPQPGGKPSPFKPIKKKKGK